MPNQKIRIRTQDLKAFYPESAPVARPYISSIGTNEVFYELQNNLFSTNLFPTESVTPFPLDAAAIAKCGYQRRPQKEEEVVKILSRDRAKFLRLIGPEGSGKSSLLHYCLGHLIPPAPEVDNRLSGRPAKEALRDPYRLYIDCQRWLGADEMENFISRTKKMLRGAFIENEFAQIRNMLQARIGRLEDLYVKSDFQMRLDSPDRDELVLAFLVARSGMSSSTGSVIIVFDNVDTLPSRNQAECLRGIVGYIDIVRSQVRSVGKHLNPDSQSGELSVVVPMRQETERTVLSGPMGDWPPDKSAATVNLTEGIDIDAWSLAQRRLESHAMFEERDLRVVAEILFPGDNEEKPLIVTPSDCRDYILGLIKWIKKNEHDFAAEFWEYCGSSIRRNLLFTLKIIGHPAIQRQYDDDRYARQRTQKDLSKIDPGQLTTTLSPRQFKRLLLHAMFDFVQPIGSKKVMMPDHFLLNPFKVVTSDVRARRDAPLLGMSLLGFLHSCCDEDVVTHKTLRQAMESLGYLPVSIDQAIASLDHAHVLKPFTDKGGETSYLIDTLLVSRYWGLLADSEEEWSTCFFIQAVRDLYGLRSYLAFSATMERAHLLLVFLHEILKAESRFRERLGDRAVSQEYADLRNLRAFGAIHGDTLLHQWRGIVDHLRREDPNSKSDHWRSILQHVDLIFASIAVVRKELGY